MSITYYLLIDGINSGFVSSNPAIKGGFEVSAFDFDIEAETSFLKGTGAAVGKPTPGPLELDLALEAGLGQLLSKIVGGTSIKSVQLVGINSALQSSNKTVYDLRLNQVFVTSLHDEEGTDHLSLVYKQVTLETWKVDGTGKRDPAGVRAEWDIPTMTTNVSPDIAVPNVSSKAVGTEANPDDYYLFIEGLNGGVTVKGFEGAFKVTGHSFDVNAETSFLNGTGASVGKPTPGELVLDLENMSGGEASLIGTIVKGTHYGAARLVGATNTGAAQPEVVYDLRLKDVFLTSLQDSAEGDQLSLVFKEVSLTTKPQLNDGSLGSETTVHWNVSMMTQDTAQLPAAVPAKGAAPPAPDKYYLLIDGINSGFVSSNPAIKGGFEVSAFDFDIEAETSFLKGTGAAVGKPTPGPLELDLALEAGLGQLLSKIVGGTSIKSVQLVGINSALQSSNKTVYDLRLNQVFVTSLHDEEGTDHLSLVYKQVTLETWKVDGTGKRDPAGVRAEWDIPTMTTNVSPDIAVPNVSSKAVGTEANPDDYYLFIEGLNGGVTVKGFEGAFKVTGHSFDVNAETSFLNGTGASVGKPTPGELVLDLENMSGGEASLIGTIVKGTHYGAARLVGATNTGAAQPEVVYDLRLKDVFLTSLQDSAEGDQLSLVFKEVSLTTKPQLNDGSLGSETTVHWNVSMMTQDTAQLPAAVPAKGGAPTGNHPPTGAPTTVLPAGTEDTDYTFSTAALLAGFSDADGDSLAVANLSTNQDLTDNGNGTWTLTPNANYHGPVTLEYNVIDGKGGLLGATLGFTLDAVNDAPTGTASALLPNGTTGQDYTVSAAALLTGFDDVDGDNLAVLGLAASNSLAVENADGSWTISPQPGTVGPVSLLYQVTDGHGGSVAATQSFVLIEVVNHPPVGSPSTTLPDGLEDTAYLVHTTDLLAGFSDPDDDTLAVSGLAANHGTITDNADGTWTVTPDLDYHGTVTLSYNVVDNRGGTIPAALNFLLTATANQPATGLTTGVLLAGTEDTAYSISDATLLAGFSDPNGDELSVGGLTVDHGTLHDNADGTWSFVAEENFNGWVKLHYEVLDGQGGHTPSTRDFALVAVNDAPLGTPLIALLNGTEDVPFTLLAETLLDGFSDVEGDPLAVANLSATHATVVDNFDGSWTVTPEANFNGLIDLNFDVIDGQVDGITPATMGLKLSAVDDASVLGSANVTVYETNVPLVVTGTLSIHDVDSAAWFVAQPGSAGKSGNFTIDTNGNWTYKANLAFDYLSPGDSLSDSFQVLSNDGTLTSVAVTIAGTADAASVHLGDAPAAQSGTGGQWAQAWSQAGYNMLHKADYTNGDESWSAVKLSGVSSQLLSGGDIYAGDLGVSGQSVATSTIKQEIDGKEALRINLPALADSVALNLTKLFSSDDGGLLNESGVLRLLDAAGVVVAEKVFVANALDGILSVTLGAAGGFTAMELIAGSYDGETFVHGGYSTPDGSYGGPVTTDALGKLHGSDFLLDSVDFALSLVGVPPP